MNDSLLSAGAPEAKQETDPDQLVKLLELQLARERIAWDRKKAQRKSARALSIGFVILMLLGIVVAAYLAWNQQSSPQSPSSSATAEAEG